MAHEKQSRHERGDCAENRSQKYQYISEKTVYGYGQRDNGTQSQNQENPDQRQGKQVIRREVSLKSNDIDNAQQEKKTGEKRYGLQGRISSRRTDLIPVDEKKTDNSNAHEVQSLVEEMGDKYGKAQQLGNIGSVYRDKAENKKALEYYTNSLTIFEDISDKVGTANQCANIGYIYAVDQKPNEAVKWFKKALPLYEELQINELAEKTRQNIQNLTRSRT